MGVAPAAKETLRQRNKGLAGGRGLRGIQQNRVSERVFDPDAGGTGEDESSSGAAISKKGVIGGVLDQQPAEVGFGAKIAGGDAAFDGGVVSTCAFQIVIAAVAGVEKIRSSYPGRLGEERDEVVGDLNVAGFYAAIGKAVSHAGQFAASCLV